MSRVIKFVVAYSLNIFYPFIKFINEFNLRPLLNFVSNYNVSNIKQYNTVCNFYTLLSN